MDWMEEVRENLKKRRQILFSKDAACLQPLAAQLAQQPHTVLVLWALAWACGALSISWRGTAAIIPAPKARV